MFSLLLLIGICVGYYYLNLYYPREEKEHIYFGIFVTVSIILIYLFNFEEGLIYKVFRNIYDIQKKPLYDLSFFKDNQDENNLSFNSMLLQNQGSRCGQCGNFILPKDIHYTSLNYRIPLNQGGQHSHNNLMVVCPNCNTSFY
tara:strand:+ start:344 stop:772 length:429 start_codon:yes stop_codon:yes gene_type:complete